MCVRDLEGHERCSHLLNSACSASRHPKIPFHCVIKRNVVSSSCWCGACLQWWSNLRPVDLFLFFSLSSPKNYSLLLLGVNIHFVLISQFWFWFFCKSLIYFQFYSSISIYQILYYPLWSLFYGFLIFIISPFIKILVIFYFILQFKLLLLYFLICSSLF